MWGNKPGIHRKQRLRRQGGLALGVVKVNERLTRRQPSGDRLIVRADLGRTYRFSVESQPAVFGCAGLT